MRQKNVVKKMYAVIMLITMIFTTLPINFVTAAESDKKIDLSISADKTEVVAGDEVTVLINLDTADSKLATFEMYLDYDESKLEYKKGSFSSIFGSSSWFKAVNLIKDGVVKLTGMDMELMNDGAEEQELGVLKETGSIATLKFVVKENVSGNVEFNLRANEKENSTESNGKCVIIGNETVPAIIKNNTKVVIPVTLQKIELNKSSLELNVGESSDKLQVTYYPENTTDDKTVTWTSSDTSIATVTDGVVKATTAKVGTATITATVGNKKVSIPVTVKAPLKGINVKSETSLEKGKSEELKVTLNPTYTTDNVRFIWSSDNEEVATVDQNGKVTAVGKGTANITVKTSDNKFSKTCKVGVTVPIESITLSESTVTLERGVDGKETKVITATVNPVDATDEVNVAWVSNNQDIATVERIDNKSAKITAVSNGDAEITATLAGKSAKAQVKVVTPVKSIALSKTNDEITAGQTDTLTVTYNPVDTTTAKNITWTSSDNSVATVSNGTVKALKPGTVTITATLNADKNIKAECTYTVKPVPMTGVQLDKKSVTLNKGQNAILTAKILPENTTDSKEIKWESSDTTIATVDQNGKVTAVGKGTVTITATSVANPEYKDECTVTVLVPLTGISIDKTAVTLEKGIDGKDTATIITTKLPNDTTDTTVVTYTSSNTNVATVDQNGKITAVGKGTATITAKAGSFTKVCNVTVVVPLESIAINEQNVDMYLKTTKQLTVKINPTDASVENKKVTFKSSDEKVATVDKYGVVTAVSEGKVTITATLDGKEATSTIEVKRLPLNSIAIKEDVTTMKKGETTTLSVIAEPEETTDDYTITWKSSDEKVAIVDEKGVVTALSEGKVIITATADISDVEPASIEIEVTEVKLETVTIDKSDVSKDDLVVGKEFKLSFKVNPEDTTDDYEVIWVSSDANIATIDNSGNVKALKEGKVKFTVQAIAADGREVTDTYEVYINPVNTEKVETPSTGDMNVTFIILTMIVCGLVMMAILRKRKVNVK